MELSKKEKKIAREIIETGLQKEFAKGLYGFDSILHNWKNKKTDDRDTYHLLYKSVRAFDKHIAHRYDGIRGSDYLFVIAAQLQDGIISENDLGKFSKEVKQAIERITK